ncbi:MAG: hypothetical protein K2W33_02625, partial [Burkholderiales bacterium]|nr:hypothetical protein [Burkholderiales bacterium]
MPIAVSTGKAAPSTQRTRSSKRPTANQAANLVSAASIDVTVQPAVSTVTLVQPAAQTPPVVSPSLITPQSTEKIGKKGSKPKTRSGPTKLFVLDTNVLLHDPMSLF